MRVSAGADEEEDDEEERLEVEERGLRSRVVSIARTWLEQRGYLPC